MPKRLRWKRLKWRPSPKQKPSQKPKPSSKQSPSPSRRPPSNNSPATPSLTRSAAGWRAMVAVVQKPTGQKLLRFDRRLGARFVAGADEAGRGSLAGPLVVAGVLLGYDALRGAAVRPLASLNDSKQVPVEERETLFEAVGACASAISVRIVPVGAIDRN